MRKRVIPFHIAIGPRSSAGIYTVRARSERGESVAELCLPEGLLLLARRLLQPGITLPVSDTQLLGQELGRALFVPPLRRLLLDSAAAAARRSSRLQIQLQIASLELAALPWEWLTVGSTTHWSPALREDYTLVRVSGLPLPVRPLPVSGPLRILAIAGSEDSAQLDVLSVALKGSIDSGRIVLHLLPDATPDALAAALASAAPHILHCASPAFFTSTGEVQLILGDRLYVADLALVLADAPLLRLITFTGPQGDAGAVNAALPLLATTLLNENLPAAIAFSGPLPPRLAARFAATCYRKLANGAPVDLAVTNGRRALDKYAGGQGWGVPQLRMIPGCGALFVPHQARTYRLTFPLLVVALLALAITLLTGLQSDANHTSVLEGAPALPDRQTEVAIAHEAPAIAFIPDVRVPARTIAPLPTTLLSPTALPLEQLSPATLPTALPDPSTYTTFMTGANDMLEHVAERMGSSAQAIARLNHLDPQVPLRPERPLVIPVFRSGESGVGGLVIRRCNPSQPKVALTFDIEIEARTLYGFLDILRERGIHGTFFVTGRWVKTFPDAARAIVSDGHEIGSHSLTHPFFSRIGLNGAASELEQTEQIISETTGTSARPYFRFPYGDSTPATAAIVASHGYVAYHWSADESIIPRWLDAMAANPAAGNGAILLLHGRPSSVNALPGWLDRLVAIGLQPTTLGEALR